MKLFVLWVAFGEGISKRLQEDNEVSIKDDVDGFIKRYTFRTKGERNAFIYGMEEMTGCFCSDYVFGEHASLKKDILKRVSN